MKEKFLLLLCCLLLAGPLPAQLITRTFLFSSYTRIYDLELPAAWTPGAKLPLVLDLHYLGGDARDEDTLTRFFPIADTAGFIICHPWGQSTNWNAGFNSPYSAGSRDVEFISAMIDSIDAEFGVDRSRVYAAGMGQGGFMAHRLACELSGEIAAIASVGASIADSTAYYCVTSRPVPVMIVNGTADSVINYQAGNAGFWRSIPDLVQFWLDQNACFNPVIDTLGFPDLVNEGSTVSRHRYVCSSNEEVLLYKVYQGGFAWPGAQDTLFNGGIVNQDISASAEIWKFFSRWTLQGPVGVAETVREEWRMEVWPNPVRDLATVALPGGKRSGHLRVVGPTGRVLVEAVTRAGAGEVQIDLSGLSKGIYFVILELDGERFFEKLIKE